MNINILANCQFYLLAILRMLEEVVGEKEFQNGMKVIGYVIFSLNIY
jgi:hypothetical protein